MFHHKDRNLSRRHEIYLLILHNGLLRIRGFSFLQKHREGEIEADHLHNIPSYVAGGDDAHHLYYLTVEVPLYLERRSPDDDEGRSLDWNIDLWRELETLIPIDGSPWESRWKTLKSSGWNYDA